MYLPLELRNLIFQDLTKAELKVTRLVCKSFDQAAIPFLFDEVFVAARHSDLEIADLIASRFGAYLKTITLSVVGYKSMSKKDFRRQVQPDRVIERFGVRPKKPLERFNAHSDYAYEMYCKTRTDIFQINESGELLAKASIILSKSPNIRKMVLKNCGNDDMYYTFRPHNDHFRKEDELCPFKTCNLSVSDHLSFYLRPTSPYQAAPNPLHVAMLAMSAAKTTITELAVLHQSQQRSPRESFLTKDAFDMTTRQSYQFTLQLQHLTKLRMRLSDRRRVVVQGPRADRPIAGVLFSAVNLHSLFIEGVRSELEFGHDTPTTMSSFLGGCEFPKLRSLMLASMSLTESELDDFVKTSPFLKYFALHFCALNVGSWESVAIRLRSALRLKSVMFDRLTGGFSGFKEGRFLDTNYHMVENFFLHNGEKNPFTIVAMNLWYENDSKTRSEINKVLSSEKLYDMFH